MTSDADHTASIDLAVAFFCSVLVLFVFVAFNLDNDPRPEIPVTLAQRTLTREIVPPAWSALTERGSYAVLAENDLVVLDLPAIGTGIQDPSAVFQRTQEYPSYIAGPSAAPNAFSLSFAIRPEDTDAPWQRERLSLEADADCPQTARSLITVFLPSTTTNLGPTLAYARRCGLRLRFHPLRQARADGYVSLRIALSPESYSADRMFR